MNAWKEGTDERITQVISEGLNENAPMVRDWVLMVVYVDDEGEDATAFNSHPHSTRTGTLGMLTHALLVQAAPIIGEEM